MIRMGWQRRSLSIGMNAFGLRRCLCLQFLDRLETSTDGQVYLFNLSFNGLYFQYHHRIKQSNTKPVTPNTKIGAFNNFLFLIIRICHSQHKLYFIKSIQIMERKYKILSCKESMSPLYTVYQVGEHKDRKKSLIFFNEEIQKYGMYQNLIYNASVFTNSQHSNLLRIEDFIQYQHGQQHIFEYFEENMESFVSKNIGKFNESQVFTMLRDVVSAIDGVIEQKYYPQNIRPEHFVRVDNKWKIKCVVFSDNVLGVDCEYFWNPSYTAPQLYCPKSNTLLSPQIVWGIGCIALFIIEKKHLLSNLSEIKSTYSQGFSHLSRRLQNFLNKTLNPDPAQRINLNKIKDILFDSQEYDLAKSFKIELLAVTQEGLNMMKSSQQIKSSTILLSSKLNGSRMGLNKSNQLQAMPNYLVESHLFLKSSIQDLGKKTVRFQQDQVKNSGLLIKSRHDSQLVGRNPNYSQHSSIYDKKSMFFQTQMEKHYNRVSTQSYVPINASLLVIDSESIRFDELIRDVQQKEVDNKAAILEGIKIYKYERELSEFAFKLEADLSRIPQQKSCIFVSLLACLFSLASLAHINSSIITLSQNKSQYAMSNFEAFNQSPFFAKVIAILQSSFLRYKSNFIQLVSNLKIFHYKSDCKMKSFCEYLFDLVQSRSFEHLEFQSIKNKSEFKQVLTNIYSLFKSEQNSTTSLIKLLLFRQLNTIFLKQNRQVIFNHQQMKASISEKKHISMLKFYTFIETCNDKQFLQSLKAIIAKHKFVC